MSDIRKWFMKQHDKGNGNASKPEKPAVGASQPANKSTPPAKESGKPMHGAQESSGRKKTGKVAAAATIESSTRHKPNNGSNIDRSPAKRKNPVDSEESHDNVKPRSAKKTHKGYDDDDFVLPSERKDSVDEVSPPKKLKSGSGRVGKKSIDVDEDVGPDQVESPVKAGGRGGGGRGRGAAATGGRGRGGGGRGTFMNFGERKDPPHKGEKEVPAGSPDCLAGLTFVISGTLDSLEREEAEDLIKRHGGRVTGSVSKKTSYLLADEDIGGRKSSKAKELGTSFLTEDGLFDLIRASKPATATVQEVSKMKSLEKANIPQPKSSPLKEVKDDSKSLIRKCVGKGLQPAASPTKQKGQTNIHDSLMWTEKYKPKVPNDIIGNQSIVKQLHDWLANWDKEFLHTVQKGKVKKQNDSGSKKAVLLSGSPGIGKSTSAKLVSQMLGFQIVEVNASDNRGKADAKIMRGIGGNTSNSIKELVSNESLSSNMDCARHTKSVLVMDEVDGMSAGDRGGVADLIASIKISKIPIICICNDRYSQKLKSLVNYCLLLNFRKPTKQQMAKRLMQVATAEGLKVNEIALEELANRVNGDMRMALNQLQYMSVSQSVINYDDIRARLASSSKDEDISPFSAVDKLFDFNGGKLRMDERIDLSMSDPDLVPLIIQENYINYRPSTVGRDDSGVKRMNLIARAAESVGDGDIVNVQIRRYRQWQLSQVGCFASSIIPAALMHGQRDQQAELTSKQKQDIAKWFLTNSPPGEINYIAKDIRSILSDEDAYNAAVSEAYPLHNKSHMICLELPNRTGDVLITTFGEIDEIEYLDPRTCQVATVNHVKQVCTNVRPATDEELPTSYIEEFRGALDAELVKYVAETYPKGSCSVYCISGKDVEGPGANFELAAVISAARHSPQNFCNGSWRSIWNIEFKDDLQVVELRGKLQVDAHYFEEGNVQLDANHDCKDNTIFQSPEDCAVSITNMICHHENEYMASLEASYTNLPDTTFKDLRRKLPVTRTLFPWHNTLQFNLTRDITKELGI